MSKILNPFKTMNVLIFLLISCIVAVTSKQTCSDLKCGGNECCVQPTDGNARCQAQAEEGAVCEPGGRVRTKACSCMRGSFCVQKDSNNSEQGVCDKDKGEKCGDLYCPSNYCCLHPLDGPPRCQPFAEDGEVCEPAGKVHTKLCSCEKGAYCVQKDSNNTEQGVCAKDTGEKCGNLYCPSNYCCLHPVDGPPRCQPFAEDGEVCEPNGRVHTKVCSCAKGSRCTQKDPNNNETGVCDKDSGEKCGDFSCPLNYCCIYPPDGPPSCHPLPKDGEVCEPSTQVHTKACSCMRGSFCVQKDSNNNETGVCDTIENYDKCVGGLYCANDQCCLRVPGEPPSCQPRGKKGEVCATSKETQVNACTCTEGLNCTTQKQGDKSQGVCTVPNQEQMQSKQCGNKYGYGYTYCNENQCCVTYGNEYGYAHCIPLSREGQPCNPNPAIQTHTCGCAKGLSCTTDPNIRNPTVGVCTNPNKNQPIKRQNPNLNSGVGIGGGLQG